MRRRVDPALGLAAIRAWKRDPMGVARAQVLTAVRFSLEELERLHPGHSVEVRVPPAAAVQILQGTRHRRGTPPAVVETDMATWLALATGRVEWAEARAAGSLRASGLRADLSELLPLFRCPRARGRGPR